MGNVWLLDLTRSNNQKIIENGEGLGYYQDIKWSDDSQFIALTKLEIGKQRPQIVLYSVNESKAQTLTTDKYESFSPSFSHDGKWLYFLSNRRFKANPGSPWGDRNMEITIFDKRTQIFALALEAKAAFPFAKPTELTANKGAQKADKNDQDSPAKTKVDWDGLNQRLWQVPVDAGNYNSLTATKDKLYLLDGHQGKSELKLVKFDAQQPKVETFSDDVVNMRWQKMAANLCCAKSQTLKIS
ncbi:hypothetical protein PEC18_00580 [Paucibacter sp. O1-1]|nr:hypothetical protein [Paucibacter sp. O1-1]MDA3824404.1 hypothetical protein [Paucibacter sp. O1-1]